MKTKDKLRQLQAEEQSLRWTMRLIGVALLMASLFVATRDIVQTTLIASWFFGLCAALGAVTVITSWLPGPKKPQWQESPVLPMPARRSP